MRKPVLQSAEEFASVADAVADCSLVVGTAEGSGRAPEEPLERLETVAAEMVESLRGQGEGCGAVRVGEDGACRIRT